MNSSLRASVVVPVRNRVEVLERTLDTLTEQNFAAAEYEIIVCDDGSTDDVASVVTRFAGGPVAIRLEQQAPRGPAAARNLGIRMSDAPIVIFVDGDVLADQALICLLVEALEVHPDWIGAEAALHPVGKKTGILWDAPVSTAGGHYHTATIAYRRRALLAVGGFDEEFNVAACEDVELAVRMLEHGPIGFVPKAKVWHPLRRVTRVTHWHWRRHWRYETILAVRYRILSFPGKPCGSFPRTRVALAAVATLPTGRFLSALKSSADAPADAFLAALYALFDVLCGLWALPSIFFGRIPARRDYLGISAPGVGVKQDGDEHRTRFAVVVGAHRSYATLGLCLQGLRALARHPADLIFIDNGSGGALTDWVKQRFPDITIITLGDNRLFTASYNAGVRHALEQDYEHVLIANADTEVVNPRFVAHLVEAMERHPRAAFVGPLVYYRVRGTVQTTCLPFPDLLRSVLVWLPYRFFPRMVSRQPAYEHQAEFLNGVCVLCRVQALREIGLMDETFGGYVEDTDWGWRARQMGWNSIFTPVPSLIHHEEHRGYEHHSLKSFLLKRNTVYWLLKVGRRRSARSYAVATIILARLRGWATFDREERQAHRDFTHKLQSVYSRLLAGETLGLWYGPPLDGAADATAVEPKWKR